MVLDQLPVDMALYYYTLGQLNGMGYKLNGVENLNAIDAHTQKKYWSCTNREKALVQQRACSSKTSGCVQDPISFTIWFTNAAHPPHPPTPHPPTATAPRGGSVE